MSAPSRFKNGVNGENPTTMWANLPTPVALYLIFEKQDFAAFPVTDTFTVSGTSGAAAALVSGAGGFATLTTVATTAATVAITDTNPFINFTTGQQLWFEARLSVLTAATNSITVGLVSPTQTTATNGIYFTKAAGSSSITFNMSLSGTTTSVAAITTLVSGTLTSLGFYYNPAGNNSQGQVDIFVNGAKVNSTTVMTNLPVATTLPRVAGAVAIAAAVADLTLDYIAVAQNRF